MMPFSPAFFHLLNYLPGGFWNDLSYLSSLFTRPAIGSPIQFSGPDRLTLREYTVAAMPERLRREFLHFCYPPDTEQRDQEIAYDRLYWPFAATFLLFQDNGRIIGCAQFIPRTPRNRLPAEYGRIAGDTPVRGGTFRVEHDVGLSPAAEIYRLRRAFDISAGMVNNLVTMLFKALWAKIVQTGTAYTYITCDGDSRELKNLYQRRLFFQDPGLRVCFGKNEKQWVLLRKDCLLHETRFAGLSRRHFRMQTYFRANLKKKRLMLAA